MYVVDFLEVERLPKVDQSLYVPLPSPFVVKPRLLEIDTWESRLGDIASNALLLGCSVVAEWAPVHVDVLHQQIVMRSILYRIQNELYEGLKELCDAGQVDAYLISKQQFFLINPETAAKAVERMMRS